MNRLREAAMERERRRKEAEGIGAATEADPASQNVVMDNEEEEKEPEEFENQEMEDESAPVDEEDWGDGEGWDDDDGWGDEEEEVDPVVAQALAAAAKKRELDAKVSEVRISFRPPGYHEGMVARIVGDFTDWVPFTMQMHPIKEILKNPDLQDEFFVSVKLVKGFRYRYMF